MTKTRSTKRALLMSVLSMVLCLSMLVGSTFAWFTDSVTSSGNIIKSGTLDVEMYWADGTEDPASANWEDASTGAIFNYDKWEPGYTEVRHIKIENKGTLALKYKVQIVANGEVSDLADVIDVYYVDPATQVTGRNSLAGQTPMGTLTAALAGMSATASGELAADTSDTITIALKMQESAGNEYQNLAIGADFAVVLTATQLTYEEDSFDNQYDADAPHPVLTPLVALPAAGPMSIGDTTMELTLTEDLVNALRGKVTGLHLRYATPEASDEPESIVIDYADIIDQDGKVVNLEAMGNNEPFSVKLYVGETFAAGAKIKAYHDGEKVAETTVDADGSISYSATHFCQIIVTDAYYVATYDEFYTAVYNGGTVIPTADIALSNFLVSPNAADIYLNGKNITGSAKFYFYAPVEDAKLSINGVGTVTTSTGYVSFATNGGTFTVNGGTFNLRNTNEKAHFFTQNSGKTIINGGTFISEDADTPIVYCINGFVEINGGFFQNTANPNKALLDMGNNLSYVNNQKITLRGGTFVNWNPMDSAFAKEWTNPDVPALIVLADGYEVVSETQSNGDVWYTVVHK